MYCHCRNHCCYVIFNSFNLTAVYIFAKMEIICIASSIKFCASQEGLYQNPTFEKTARVRDNFLTTKPAEM